MEFLNDNMFYRRSRPHARATGFTLVEMLAVIGIILVLTSLTVYSIQRSNGATSRHAAVRSLMGVFDQARMVAVSDGRPTYVVFASVPKNQTGLDTTALSPSMWGRAYALFEDPVLTDTATLANFIPKQRSAWLYLPVGVAFKSDGTDTLAPANLTAAKRSTSDTTQFTILSRATSTAVALTLPYLKFDAMGQIVDCNGNIVDTTSACLRVLLFEGSADSSGNEVYTNRAALIANPGSEKYALEEIRLKPTTGRAAYTLDPSNNLAASTTP